MEKRKNAFFVLLIKKEEQLPRWQLGCGQLDIQPMREYQAKFRLQSLRAVTNFFGRVQRMNPHKSQLCSYNHHSSIDSSTVITITNSN